MSFLRRLFGKPNKEPKLMISPQNKEPKLMTPPQSIIPANQDQEIINETEGFSFLVDELQTDFKEFSRVGESVKLWIPKTKNPGKVYIYHRNGPGGCLGHVPWEYSKIVISQLKKGLDYNAKIIEINNNCKIKCILYSKTKAERKEEQYKESLKKELTKPYTRKTPMTLTISTKQKATIKKGDKLAIEFNELDSYLQHGKAQWHLKFLNQDGGIVGIFDNDKNTIKKILKTHFNSYLFVTEVVDTFPDVDYSDEKKRSNWKGYPINLIITPYKSTDTK